MFWWRAEIGDPGSGIGVGFTDATLDVAEGSVARPADTARLAQVTGRSVLRLDQVHGTAVAQVAADSLDARPPVADAAVSAEAEVALMVRAADCVPVLLADVSAGLVGVAHSGRHGTHDNVAAAVTAALRARGAGRVQAWIGPHVCGACYEVPAQMQAEVAARVPEAASTTSWGTPALDLGAGVRAQLERLDVEVTVVPGCTREEPRLHSYRRDAAAAGRMAGVVWRR